VVVGVCVCADIGWVMAGCVTCRLLYTPVYCVISTHTHVCMYVQAVGVV